MPTSLITGSTTGIGAAFVAALAREGSDLVLVARTESRLRTQAAELTERYGISAEALPADLSTDAGVSAVAERLRSAQRPIDLLINNAGFGLPRTFLESSIEEEEGMLRVNVRAVMHLTHAALPQMIARGSGGIINVSSMAGFVPTETGATYSASKAWVTSFTESLSMIVGAKGVRGNGAQGVRVTALCPGFTRTEFHDRAGVEREEVPRGMWLRADDVAATGLRDHRRGVVVSVPGVQYKAAVAGSRLVPRALLRWASARVTKSD